MERTATLDELEERVKQLENPSEQDICADLRQRFSNVTLGMARDVTALEERVKQLEQAPHFADAMLDVVIQLGRIADALETLATAIHGDFSGGFLRTEVVPQ